MPPCLQSLLAVYATHGYTPTAQPRWHTPQCFYASEKEPPPPQLPSTPQEKDDNKYRLKYCCRFDTQRRGEQRMCALFGLSNGAKSPHHQYLCCLPPPHSQMRTNSPPTPLLFNTRIWRPVKGPPLFVFVLVCSSFCFSSIRLRKGPFSFFFFHQTTVAFSSPPLAAASPFLFVPLLHRKQGESPAAEHILRLSHYPPLSSKRQKNIKKNKQTNKQTKKTPPTPLTQRTTKKFFIFFLFFSSLLRPRLRMPQNT